MVGVIMDADGLVISVLRDTLVLFKCMYVSLLMIGKLALWPSSWPRHFQLGKLTIIR